MSIVSVKNLAKTLGAALVFDAVDFDVQEGERVGIVGPNGSGKSTLCALILGFDQPDEGEIMKRRSASIGHLAQHNHFDSDHSVVEEATSTFNDLFAIEEEMRDLEAAMATEMVPNQVEKLMTRHAELQEAFEREDGYAVHARVEAVLLGLGMPRELLTRPVCNLSGGEAGRLALAKLLLRTCNLLVLDEPTNHLDLDGCEWLEDYLNKHHGTCLVISHDRFFLDRVTKRTLEVAGGIVSDYPCSYSAFEVSKAEDRRRAQTVFREQQDYIRKEREFIKKNMGSQRTKEAKGRLKRLQRLELLAPPRRSEQDVKISVRPKKRLGTEIVDLEALCFGYDDRVLVHDLDLRLEPGDKLGVVGANGTGKSSLIKVILDRMTAFSGRVKIGKTVEIGYFDQIQAELDLDQSPFDVIASVNLTLSDLEVRSYLARFLVFDDDVDRPLSSFSGGEKSKVALAKILLTRPNVLILDEPTNHLDVPSRIALEEVLDDFEGVLITVSHDRYFLDRICNRILWLEAEGHHLSYGSFSAARQAKQERDETRRAIDGKERQAKKKEEKNKANNVRSSKSDVRDRHRQLEKIEAAIMTLEEEKQGLMTAMEKPKVYRDASAARDHKTRLATIDAELRSLETEWEKFI